MSDLRAILRSADSTVTDALQRLGFRRISRGIFERRVSEALAGWLGLNESTGDGLGLYPVVGVTDRELEALLAQLGGPAGAPSISVQLGYLTEEARARAWQFTGETSADEKAAADLAATVERCAFPFYERNVQRRALAASVEDLGTEDNRWFRLPLIYGLMGDRARAADVLDEATAALQGDKSEAAEALRAFIARCRHWLSTGR